MLYRPRTSNPWRHSMQSGLAAVSDPSGCEMTFLLTSWLSFSPLSCFGFVSSLNGEPEKGIAVEVCWCFNNFVSKNKTFFLMHFFCVLFSCINKAIGLESCESFQEETVSDDEGHYRLRGLQVSSVKMIELFFLIVCRRNSTKHPPPPPPPPPPPRIAASSRKEARVFT